MDKYFIEFILGNKQSLDDAIEIAENLGYKQLKSPYALDKPGHSILALNFDGTYCIAIRSKDELLSDGYEEINFYKRYPDGTKVKIIGNYSGHGLPIGTICTIRYHNKGYNFTHNYKVTDQDYEWFVNSKDIKVYTNTEFKVGDTVTIGDCNTIYRIDCISGGNMARIISIKNRKSYDYSLNKLKLYTGETTECKFKVGDIVKVIDTGNMCSTFDEAAEAMGLTKWVRSNGIYSSEQIETILKCNYYKVIGSYKHISKLYIGIENYIDGNQYIISEEGIEHTSLGTLTGTGTGINTGTGCIIDIQSMDPMVWTDGKNNILLTNNNTMEKLNQLRADKFFANEKNLVAIEALDTLLKDSIDLIKATYNELNKVESKLVGLNRKLESATNNQDVAMLKDLIASTKVVQEFVDELKGKTISKFETAKTKFDVAGYLKD